MADDGQVRIGIYVDNDGVKSSMDEAVRTVQDGTQKMSDAAEKAGDDITKSVSKGFDTAKLQQNFKSAEATVKKFATAVAGAAAGFAVWVKQSTASIDRIDKMSQKLGISRKAFQELDYAASQTGLTVEQFSSSMRFLVNATKDGGTAFEQLGINIKDATGQIKSQEDLLFETVSKLADMPDSIERSQIGFQLLGRGFLQLTPLLNRGSAGIEELRKKFHDLGIEVGDKTIDDFVDFNDTLTDFSKTLKSSFNNAIKDLIPQLKKVVEKVTEYLEPGGKLNDLLSKLADILMKFVTNILPPFLDALNWILDNAALVAGGITAIAVALKLLTGNWAGAAVSGVVGLASTIALIFGSTADAINDVKKKVEETSKITPKVAKVSGTLEQMKDMVQHTEEELKGLEKSLAQLNFERGSMGALMFAAKQEQLNNKIKDAKDTIAAYTAAINELEEAQKEAEALELEIDYFKDWTTAVSKAEQQLKKFIATKAKENKGVFNLELLSDEDRAEYDRLTQIVDNTESKLESLVTAFNHANKEISKTDAFEKWTNALKEAQEALNDFVAEQAELQGGTFDKSLLSPENLEKYTAYKDRVDNATKALDTLKAAVSAVTEEEQENIEATKQEEDAFYSWSQAVTQAEKDLKKFIASKSNADTGFNVETLSAEDLARYEELKTKVADTNKALESMNAAVRDARVSVQETSQTVAKTDAFEKWTTAVADAEKALKEFIASSAESYGTFDVSLLTEAERTQFEQLRDAVKNAREELQKLQEGTNTTVADMSDKLVNVADTIASAWGKVGLAFGNGIETVISTIVQGQDTLTEVLGGLADTMADALSAVGDALIQSGIAKKVAESLESVSPGYAIAMGIAIKAAAGVIKGLLANIKASNAGSYATGGIIGGSSYSGDRLLARVNSGEMILNRKQQQQLFALANGRGGGGVSGGSNIQIINNAGAQVSAEQSFDGKSIKIMVEKFTSNMLRGVKGSRLMGQTYGIRQLGRH